MDIKLNSTRDLATLRDKIEAALDELGDELGVEFKPGNIRYDNSGENCVLKLEVAKLGNDGAAVDQYRVATRSYGYRYGLTEDMIGTEFQASGETWLFRGVRPSGRKYCIVAERKIGGNILYHTQFAADKIKNSYEKNLRDAA